MKGKTFISMLFILILGCEIIYAKAASFSSSNAEDECPKKTELECQKVNLYCCVTPSIKGQCCTEKEYFDQFPKLSDSHAEPRSVVRGLLKIIGIIIGAALFVTGVCIVCCCCCPFCLCAKHRKGTVLRQGAEQIPPDQSQQQPLSQQPQAQPQFQGGYPQQQPGYQPVSPYPDNPPPYPGPPLENQVAQAPPLAKSDYDRQPAYNPGS